MRGALPSFLEPSPQPSITSIVVKLASRCNLACDYCYWFRDRTVLHSPKVLSEDLEAAFVRRVESHLRRHGLRRFTIIFHGGEPLLFGKPRFARLCHALRAAEPRTTTSLDLQVTTNGVLVDEEWAALFRHFRVGVALSIDGTAQTHDRHRRDLRGRPTHARVVDGLAHLRAFGIEPGILAVADPGSDPGELLNELVNVHDCLSLDVLVPDATHDDDRLPIAPYFVKLFDLWYDGYAGRGVHVRLFDAIIRGLCGFWSGVESIGRGPTVGATLCTDGKLEAHDVVRIAGDGSTASSLNILTNEIDELESDPLWRELYAASTNLPQTCRNCEFYHACGGGHIASRWSSARRFDNPSSYCEDWKIILAHVWSRIATTLTYEVSQSA
ncbi:MAG: radical SAM protein [Candidatus Eremiobacteraeota bacterium]|nr:radical SAM protein [Candidatus Eremiobacteraeota bacterium]